MAVPITEIEGTWEEVSLRAAEFAGRRLRVIVLPPEESEPSSERRWTAQELLKLPPSERDHILAAQAALAEQVYRSDPELTNFEAFGDEDFFDETP